MKKKEYQDLKLKTSKDLSKFLKDKRLELTKIKVDLKVSREKDLKKAKNLRRDIAQILTFIREREIIEESLQTEKGESQKAQKESPKAQKKGEGVESSVPSV